MTPVLLTGEPMGVKGKGLWEPFLFVAGGMGFEEGKAEQINRFGVTFLHCFPGLSGVI